MIDANNVQVVLLMLAAYALALVATYFVAKFILKAIYHEIQHELRLKIKKSTCKG